MLLISYLTFQAMCESQCRSPCWTGDTSYAHQGPQLLKTQLPKRTDTCGVCMCVFPAIPRGQDSAATQPQTATLFVRFTCWSQGFHLLRLQRMQPTRNSRWEKRFLFAYFLSIQGWHGGGFWASHDWNHHNRFLMGCALCCSMEERKWWWVNVKIFSYLGEIANFNH